MPFTPVPQSVPLLSFPLQITPFWERSLLRASKEEVVSVQIANPSEQPLSTRVRLIPPAGVEVIGSPEVTVFDWSRRTIYCWFLTAYGVPRSVPEKDPSATASWKVRAAKPGSYTLQFEIDGERVAPLTATLPGTFEATLPDGLTKGEIPPPIPAVTGDIKVGASFYPGWVPGTGWGWSVLDPYPSRKPALGYYDDSNPEVIDWQIKWALEHGISFFNICWFRERGNKGKPVEVWRSDTLHKGVLNARFLKQFEFAITWENFNSDGISSREDMLENVMPFWIENYFKNPSYLRFEGKPVLFVYSVPILVAELGGNANAAAVLDEMRQQCVSAGLNGLVILGEYRGDDIPSQELIRDSGHDGMWAYGIEKVSLLEKRKAAAVLPDVATFSVGWDPRPWQDYMGYWWTGNWSYSPTDFQEVAAQTKKIAESYPPRSIGRHIVQIDNWNEWGEGHWIAPSRHVGFGYLEAIREVFAPASKKPVNLLPEEVGMGPYEGAYQRWVEEQKKALEAQRP